MFGSEILEVGVGMALLFLFMSLIATAVREFIENVTKSRSKNLERGIKEMLAPGTTSGAATTTNLVKEFYEHPLIASLYEGQYSSGSKKLPSYIPRQSFALAVLDIVAGASRAGQQLSVASLRAALAGRTDLNNVQRVVLTTLDTAGNDLESARKKLEDWYDGTMDRVSGWYTRNTGRILGVIGIGAAVFFNVDAITVAQHLISDRALRSSVVAQAERVVDWPEGYGARGDRASPPPGTPGAAPDSRETLSPTVITRPLEDISQIRHQLDRIGYPIGWARDAANNYPYPLPQACSPKISIDGSVVYNCKIGTWLAVAPFGWIITALAIMLGAPFWFDVLNKFMVVRSTVKPREKSPDEASVDRQPFPHSGAQAGQEDPPPRGGRVSQ